MDRRAYSRGSAAAIAIAGAVSACLSGEDVNLGQNVEAGARPFAGIGIDASAPGDAGDSLLSAAITATMGTICSGACVDLFATASQGTAPYTYSWGQGLGEGPGPKSDCPVATKTYSVVVGSSSNEEQSTASATVTVVPCDSGVAPALSDGATAPTSDSGAAPGAPATICVPNPSFEATTTIGTGGTGGIPPGAAPPRWQVCSGAPNIDPSVSLVPASNGMTYVGFAVGSGTFATVTSSIGTTLCSPIQAGTDYSFCLDLGVGVRGVMSPAPLPSPAAPTLQIWGDNAPCVPNELLWTSPPITNQDSWTTVCGSFVASQDLPGISLIPALASTTSSPGSWSYVIVDNIVPGP